MGRIMRAADWRNVWVKRPHRLGERVPWELVRGAEPSCAGPVDGEDDDE